LASCPPTADKDDEKVDGAETGSRPLDRSRNVTTSAGDGEREEPSPKPDPFQVIEELLSTGFIDGMLRRLHAQFADLDQAAIEDAIFQAAEQFAKLPQPPADPRAWLFAVARYRLLDERRRWPVEPLGPEHEEHIGAAPSAEEIALRDETYRAVVDHVRKWPVAKRRDVVLLVLEAAHLGIPMSDAELAEQAGFILGEELSVNAAAIHKSRGLALLRQEFPTIFPDS
jgi:DNA-directed RNA polymerase specialized sigma24 family protein